MAIYKNANLDISVDAVKAQTDNSKPSFQFSTQDKNTAKYTFTVKQNKKPVDLTDVKASVTLYSEDKSVFQSDATVTNAAEGKVEYVIPAEAIRHHGKTRGDLRLTYPNGDVLGGLRFSFNIEQALIDRAAGVIGGVYIRDFEQLKEEIQATADSIKDIDIVRIDTKLNELEQKVEEGGVGVDEQARQVIQEVSAQLAETAKKEELLVRQPARYGKVKFPSDFIPVDFELYRKPDGRVYHNIDIDKRYRNKNIQRVIYTSIANGNNTSGDGTEANPYRTPNKAFEVAAAAAETNIKIIVDADEILRNEFFIAIDVYVEIRNKHIVVTTKDGKKIPVLNGDSTARASYRIDGPVNGALPAWTKTSGNVYQTSRSNTSYVVDTMFRHEFTGKIKKMTKVNSIAECESTAGSYYINGSTVHVHTFDNRQPDGKVTCVLTFTGSYSMFRLYNSLLFMENFEFCIHDGSKIRGDTTSHVILNECDFGETSTVNSLTLLHAGKTYLLECSTHDSFLDGFNYHYPTGVDNRNCLVFEYNCFGYNNGNEPNGTGNNFTTLHDGASIIRVNSFGEESQGVVCADVGGSYSILIDCQMMNSKLPSSNVRSASYQFTTDTGTRTAKAVLINCVGVSSNKSIITDRATKGTELTLESWHEGLDKIKYDVAL